MTDFSSQNDNALVDLVLLGNSTAYEELVRRHEYAVKGTAYKVTGNRFLAEDAAQDAFVTAWLSLNSLREHGKFGSWVCAIAKNCARGLIIRYRNAIPGISLDTALLQPESGDGEPMDEDFSRRQELREAMDTLSDSLREVVRLHYFDGYSVTEIAEMLSVPEGTVKWRLSKGRKELRKGYGIMEDKYDEKEAFTKRVMRQVEQLKLWRLKIDKTGFEQEYQGLLALIDSMEESPEKHHARADMLDMCYWWIPGKENDEIFSRMKEEAEKGHNENVMEGVIAIEYNRCESNPKRITKFREEIIPYLEKLGFRGTLGYAYFWLGHTLLNTAQRETMAESLSAFEKVLEILQPCDIYYATALSAAELIKRLMAMPAKEGREDTYRYHAVAEEYHRINGKWQYWSQPGFGASLFHESIFYNTQLCDSLLLDPGMKPGDSVISSDKKLTLLLERAGVSLQTPAGVFENCVEFLLTGEYLGRSRCIETAYCPGVGIVRQIIEDAGDREEWQLSAYEVKDGGKELLPLDGGNRWEYALVSAYGVQYDITNRYELIFREKDKAIMKWHCFAVPTGYEDSFDGWKEKMKQSYWRQDENDPNSEILQDVSAELRMLAERAASKRQKQYAVIAGNVMERILRTDKALNPVTKTESQWNFFEMKGIVRKDGKILWDYAVYDHFEWKTLGITGEGEKVLYNFLYDSLTDTTNGVFWSEDWVLGYTEEKKNVGFHHHNYRLEVLPDETVETPAGTFENCRHLFLDLTNTNAWWKGKMEYWFAPGVGIVKFSHPLGKEERENIWQLTDCRGKGEGYFPIDDGLFRRYEPKQLGDGWRASVEYTFDEDENGTVLFRNALGERDL